MEFDDYNLIYLIEKLSYFFYSSSAFVDGKGLEILVIETNLLGNCMSLFGIKNLSHHSQYQLPYIYPSF